MTDHSPGDAVPWWRDAVMYQVYLRSFADGNGDGIGDLPGVRAHLPYLHDLGVDGIWITPWYPSPMKDGGYDVADYCDIDPLFGSLADARALLDDAHALGLKVIVDFVANHTSDQHAWFAAALASPPGSPARARYHFRDGKGPDGDEPPNDWVSAFGGRAWTRITEADGSPGQWYLHLFASAQPDLNWDNPEVREDFEAILRFWFDFGLDGLRLDAASGLAKEPGLPDFGFLADDLFMPVKWVGSPLWDVEGVHEILRDWRTIADSYEGDRMFVGEIVVNGPERLARYMRPDELHTTFNLDFLKSSLDPAELEQTITAALHAFDAVGAPATWTLSNHDETRQVTRYGRAFTGVPLPPPWPPPPCDRELGRRRARAMLLVMLALPGSVYLYQGEELGLWEVEDLADADLQDPIWENSGHTIRGRDGCRVPLPWTSSGRSLGFSAGDARPWLPQPADWAQESAEAQAQRADSTLAFYRAAVRARREHLSAAHGLSWARVGDGVLAFDRGPLRCLFNRRDDAVPIAGTLVLASEPATADTLAVDVAAWVRP
jgi:alpha-glucosidase